MADHYIQLSEEDRGMTSMRIGGPRTRPNKVFRATGSLLSGSVLAAGLLVGCGTDPGTSLPTLPLATSPEASSSSTAETVPETVPATEKTKPRVCGGYERPDLSVAECELVNSSKLGLIAIETCTTYRPSGGSIAAVECKGNAGSVLSEGEEPSVYIFRFAALDELQEAFDSNAADLGLAEGDVLHPPAVDRWSLTDDPPDVDRGQVMSRVEEGETIFVWTDWDELLWFSAESTELGIEALHDWWSLGEH